MSSCNTIEHRYADPEAAHVVCESKLPLVFVPLDATECVPYVFSFKSLSTLLNPSTVLWKIICCHGVTSQH